MQEVYLKKGVDSKWRIVFEKDGLKRYFWMSNRDYKYVKKLFSDIKWNLRQKTFTFDQYWNGGELDTW